MPRKYRYTKTRDDLRLSLEDGNLEVTVTVPRLIELEPRTGHLIEPPFLEQGFHDEPI